MAANNGNFQNDAEEYEWVLNNSLLWDAVFNHFGYDINLQYGTYRQVDPWMRTIILTWVRRQDFYWDELYGYDEEDTEEDEEDQQDAQQNVVEQQNEGDAQQNVVEQQNEGDAQQNVVEQQNEEHQQQNVVEHQNVVVDQNQGGQQDEFADPYNLEKRITELEITFRYLKRLKWLKSREAESSGSN